MPSRANGHFRLTDSDLRVFLRGAIARDLPYVQDIELRTYDNPWDTDIWKPKIEHARVAIVQKKIVGFWYGDQVEDHIRVIRISVHPTWQCRGIGTILFYDLEQAHPTASTSRVLVMEHQSDSFYALRKNGYLPVQNLGPTFEIPGMWEKENAYAFQKELPNRS